mmetsp:Transcript_112254/g.317281  ORF Transcript_112254/g.317281 Transcript_112254/m.317281 type:complete len:233 (-) Transcript_112254:271-969(-)
MRPRLPALARRPCAAGAGRGRAHARLFRGRGRIQGQRSSIGRGHPCRRCSSGTQPRRGPCRPCGDSLDVVWWDRHDSATTCTGGAIAGASACSREPGDAGPWRIATNAAPASSASASWRLAPLFDRGGHCNSGRSAKCSHCAAIAGCREKRALALQSALAPYTARGQRRFHNPLAPRATWDPHEQPGCCANGRDEELGAEHKHAGPGFLRPPWWQPTRLAHVFCCFASTSCG